MVPKRSETHVKNDLGKNPDWGSGQSVKAGLFYFKIL